MVITTEYVNIPMSGPPMRTFVAAPKAEGRYPGIWSYSDIFQLTPPTLRACVRLAGYGFVVAGRVWIGSRSIPRSQREKLAPLVFVSAATLRFVLRFSRMYAPRLASMRR